MKKHLYPYERKIVEFFFTMDLNNHFKPADEKRLDAYLKEEIFSLQDIYKEAILKAFTCETDAICGVLKFRFKVNTYSVLLRSLYITRFIWNIEDENEIEDDDIKYAVHLIESHENKKS